MMCLPYQVHVVHVIWWNSDFHIIYDIKIPLSKFVQAIFNYQNKTNITEMHKVPPYLLLVLLFHGCESPTALSAAPSYYGDHGQYLNCEH